MYGPDLQFAKLTNTLRTKKDVSFRVGLRPCLRLPPAPQAAFLGIAVAALGTQKPSTGGRIGLNRFRAAVNDIKRTCRPRSDSFIHKLQIDSHLLQLWR